MLLTLHAIVLMCQHFSRNQLCPVHIHTPLDPQVDLYTRAAAPPHTRLFLPFARLKNLAQLRIGCAHLEVEQGRKRRPAVPRQDRLCKLCSVAGAPQEGGCAG
jgi:hypothetical protein